MPCPNCGGSLIGDGYSTVLHCEFASEELYDGFEPDADPVFCKFEHPCEGCTETNCDACDCEF